MLIKDISVLARLVNARMHEDVGADDLAGLSPIFQPVARRLLTARPDEYQPIWEEFLAERLRQEQPALDESATPTRARTAVTARWDPHQLSPVPTAMNAATRRRRLKMTCAADLEPRAVDWLWSGRVPLGMITMFAGDPKLGKSYVTLGMAAALSRGLPLPLSDRPNRPGSTIVMSAEDDQDRTIVPRLVAGGADRMKIHFIDSVILADGSETLPSLRADIDAIKAAAAALGDCRLIVIDPVSAYLDGVDDNRNVALRGVLTPLSRLAEQLGAAVVLVSHLTKAGSNNGKHRVLGSIAYIGACRANHLFVADPDDPTGRRVLMVDNGSNIAPPASALAYTIEDRASGSTIEWSHEPVTTAVGNSLKPAQSPQFHHDEQAARHRDCDEWLRAFLAERRRSTADVLEAATDAGFSKDQVRRAKSRIGAIARRVGFDKDAEWSWGLRGSPFSR